MANNALQRTVNQLGLHPFTQQPLGCSVRQAAPWSAAELGR